MAEEWALVNQDIRAGGKRSDSLRYEGDEVIGGAVAGQVRPCSWLPTGKCVGDPRLPGLVRRPRGAVVAGSTSRSMEPMPSLLTQSFSHYFWSCAVCAAITWIYRPARTWEEYLIAAALVLQLVSGQRRSGGGERVKLAQLLVSGGDDDCSAEVFNLFKLYL